MLQTDDIAVLTQTEKEVSEKLTGVEMEAGPAGVEGQESEGGELQKRRQTSKSLSHEEGNRREENSTQ